MSDFEMPTSKDEAKVASKGKNDAVKEENVQESAQDKPKYDKNELLSIFDELIFSGTYVETVNIRGGKLKVGFRTRSAEEVEQITRVIDTTTANLMTTLIEKRQLINLHYALTNYQGKDLSLMKLEDRAKFINSLAAPIIGALMIKLGEFDDKVYAACKEGEENF